MHLGQSGDVIISVTPCWFWLLAAIQNRNIWRWFYNNRSLKTHLVWNRFISCNLQTLMKLDEIICLMLLPVCMNKQNCFVWKLLSCRSATRAIRCAPLHCVRRWFAICMWQCVIQDLSGWERCGLSGYQLCTATEEKKQTFLTLNEGKTATLYFTDKQTLKKINNATDFLISVWVCTSADFCTGEQWHLLPLGGSVVFSNSKLPQSVSS